MVTFNRYRKLIQDSTYRAVGDSLCSIQCDREENPGGLCFHFCLAVCPSVCRNTCESPPPLSSPSPATGPYPQTTTTPEHRHMVHPRLNFPLKICLFFFVATLIYTLYKFYTVWYRFRRHRTAPLPSPENQESHDNDGFDHPIWYIRTTGLQLSVINAITVVKFSKGIGVVQGTDCTVCLSEFGIDETLRLLPICKHAFHISCIDTWLRSHTNCPLCRAGIVNNTVDTPSPGFIGETNSRISVMDDDDREEASESSELTIDQTDEEDVNGNIRMSVSLEDLAASDHPGIRFQSFDGDLGIESVKIAQTTDNVGNISSKFTQNTH